MANEYMLPENSGFLWGAEGTPYSEAATTLNYFGILPDAIDCPHPNPMTALSSQGHGRRPFTYSGDEKEYQISIPVLPIDARIPLEAAIGSRVKANAGSVGYQTMSNSDGVGGTAYTGLEVIADATHKVKVNVDGAGVTEMDVVTSGSNTVTEMLVIWQAALRLATSTLATVELTAAGLIKVSGVVEGAAGSISMSAGTSSDLLTALSAIADVTNVVDVATAGVTDSYSYTFEEDDKITDTITIYRKQTDLDINQKYIGCKASLNLSASVGEPLKATFDFMGTHYEFETAPGSFLSASPSLPVIEPYRFWQVEDAKLNTTAGVLFKDLASIKGFDFGWDNGLKVLQTRSHLRDSTYSREGYAIAEETGAEKYDMKIDLILADYTVLQEVYDDDTLFDFEIKFTRVYGDETETFEIFLYDCKFGDVPLPSPTNGAIEISVPLLCKDTKIVITTEESITV